MVITLDRWQLLWSYRPRLVRIASKIVSNVDDADDAASEAITRIAPLTDLPDDRLWSALANTTIRICYDQHRRVAKKRRSRSRLEAYESIADTPVDERILDRHEAAWLRSQLKWLPRAQRDVVVLRCRGLSNAQIGTELGIGIKAVESSLHRGRCVLRGLATPVGAVLVLWRAAAARTIRLRWTGPVAPSVALTSAAVGVLTAVTVLATPVDPPSRPADTRGAAAPASYVERDQPAARTTPDPTRRQPAARETVGRRRPDDPVARPITPDPATTSQVKQRRREQDLLESTIECVQDGVIVSLTYVGCRG